jgi:hypothetical protein
MLAKIPQYPIRPPPWLGFINSHPLSVPNPVSDTPEFVRKSVLRWV